MKSFSQYIFIIVAVGLLYILFAGINFYAFGGIEDGVITGFRGSNGIFESIDRAKYITITANFVGLLIIAFLWSMSLLKSNKNN